MTQIKEIPDLPQELMSAIDSDSLSIFTGAGVSQLVGCWSWRHLSNELVKSCYGNNYINYRQQEILLSYKDYKKVITICYNIL
ncbi:MAG: hypothetical protein NWE89_00375, partial [Candidatus Bathyarchaeota archaeon]|nr:hypothetical protein [Candidatus Bathyarchaeota archaeon]